jgi:SprT protein
MKREYVERLARLLMRKHGLEAKGWSFGFDNAKTRHGQCDYDRRRITISRHFSELNSMAVVKDTLLHEIAHGILGQPGIGHGREWRNIAVAIGARPVARKGAPIKPASTYDLWCPECEAVVGGRYRRTKTKYRHIVCGSRVVLRESTAGGAS